MKTESEGFRHSYDRSSWLREFAKALGVRPTHIIDLNFDNLLRDTLGCGSLPRGPIIRNINRSGIRVEDARNMARRWDRSKGNITVWKPHGWIGILSSIRLGARDYGLQAAAYNLRFQRFKQVEKRAPTRLDTALVPFRKPASSMTDADTWITRIMAFETSMIGVGMTSDEWALRWLCVQRDRNGAQRDLPPIRWHVRNECPMLPGVALVGHGTWEGAWQALLGGCSLSSIAASP